MRVRSHAATSRGCLAAFVVVIGCSTPQAPPALPAGIAEMRIPFDAATLRGMASDDDAAKRLDRRRNVIAVLHRQLLMPPPDDALVPELFDVVVALAPRVDAGAMSTGWSSYLYTTYQRDLRAERPDGRPRRTSAAIAAVLDRWVEFYQIRADPRRAKPAAETHGFEALRDYRDDRRRAR